MRHSIEENLHGLTDLKNDDALGFLEKGVEMIDSPTKIKWIVSTLTF